jgi:hypothetical protein
VYLLQVNMQYGLSCQMERMRGGCVEVGCDNAGKILLNDIMSTGCC